MAEDIGKEPEQGIEVLTALEVVGVVAADTERCLAVGIKYEMPRQQV